MRIRSFFLPAVMWSVAMPVSGQDTLRFEPTIGYPTFAVREPVARIAPGTVLVSRTMHGDYYNPGGGAFPGEVGPYVVYLPIFNDGAYSYFGDGHARQGEGEVNGTGLETSMDVTLKIDLVRGKQIAWPRLEDATHIMVAGSARPLIDAFRLAHVELVEWLVEDYGFGKWDAYMLVGQLGENTIGNIVDPIYTVVANFPKEYLPR